MSFFNETSINPNSMIDNSPVRRMSLLPIPASFLQRFEIKDIKQMRPVSKSSRGESFKEEDNSIDEDSSGSS
jgi:hypothetical protein